MADDLLPEVAFGAIASELLKELLDAKRKAAAFRFLLEQLENTLASVLDHVTKIQGLSNQLDHPRLEINRLVALLEEGKQLVHKFSNVPSWNYLKRYKCAKKILKWDESLRRFFNIDMQVTQSRDIKEILMEVQALGQKVDGISQGGIIGSGSRSLPEEFSILELAAATNNFSLESKIKGRSSGVMYRGVLSDGREVVIEKGAKKQFEEKEVDLALQLEFLSRPHHKHIVRLIGFCKEMDERLFLVYEYMKNGTLDDHLHCNNAEEHPMHSWQMRIKISLEAARGIECLHNDAVQPRVHGNIKSSNILLDGTWTARVSGLALMGAYEPDHHNKVGGKVDDKSEAEYTDYKYYYESSKTAGKRGLYYRFAAQLLVTLIGTQAASKTLKYSKTFLVSMGYRSNYTDQDKTPTKTAADSVACDHDAEHYNGWKIIMKRMDDVYSFGVVLLELLTGKRPTFMAEGEDGRTSPLSLVEYAVPAIMNGDLGKVIDPRVRQSQQKEELEAVELLANTAMQCVKAQGNERPTITDVVADLNRAFFCCLVGSDDEGNSSEED